jgi:hypothetical protein
MSVHATLHVLHGVERVMDPDFRDYVVARTPALLRTAYLLTGDRGEAEDLLHEVLFAHPRRGRRYPPKRIREVAGRVNTAEPHDADRFEVAAGQAVQAAGGERVRYSTPDGADYIAVCRPACTPDTVHRED